MTELAAARQPVDITGLDRAAVLRAAYNGAHALGAARGEGSPTTLSLDRALRALAYHGSRIDYLNGRRLDLDLSTDHVEAVGYDAANAPASLADVVARLRDLLTTS